MATFYECPNCGNQISVSFAELEEQYIQTVCTECKESVTLENTNYYSEEDIL